ncbi:uncharacterized protein SPPG_09294 [Spizellomyces punctatus DAOM BR117]|uniref:Uncharacterized protein n=1 Tax=Spizellomyces punctatus (strain DAOM BR117) TaxID=645134 RepID=A0A0L0HE69_SPIPD|nr:uncharacterized protein SPPG_09294 [Spizellomyces punctatus DAOM BR117]KNC99402.1 hypothetical protein SPPG_09294 [Spizellomyces punctatus DAOM BR117]|eukprot:XP_016607442.1 hypothetical protein SPPG_09294 [Spizellomyces punctatus DAOM BR117]
MNLTFRNEKAATSSVKSGASTSTLLLDVYDHLFVLFFLVCSCCPPTPSVSPFSSAFVFCENRGFFLRFESLLPPFLGSSWRLFPSSSERFSSAFISCETEFPPLPPVTLLDPKALI